MGKVALLFSCIMIINSAKALAQNGELPTSVSRTDSYTCEINGEISLAGDPKKIDGQTLSGRGMATCHNDQGFTTDYPIIMKLTADTSLKDVMTNAGVKAVAEPFAVNRDPNEMFDQYSNYDMLHRKVAAELVRTIQPAAVSRGIASSRSITLHGAKNKLFINMTLMGGAEALQNLKIHSFTLDYDDQAPTLD